MAKQKRRKKKTYKNKRLAVVVPLLMFLMALFLIGGIAMSMRGYRSEVDDKQRRIEQLEQTIQENEERNEELEQKLQEAKDAITFNPEELLRYTNDYRESQGLRPLRLNESLNEAALSKAEDMKERNYWSHNTPEGREPWYFISNNGYNYEKAGENLAYGYLLGGQTVQGWIASDSHRENILDSEFTEVGFATLRDVGFQEMETNANVVVAFYARPK